MSATNTSLIILITLYRKVIGDVSFFAGVFVGVLVVYIFG